MSEGEWRGRDVESRAHRPSLFIPSRVLPRSRSLDGLRNHALRKFAKERCALLFLILLLLSSSSSTPSSSRSRRARVPADPPRQLSWRYRSRVLRESAKYELNGAACWPRATRSLVVPDTRVPDRDQTSRICYSRFVSYCPLPFYLSLSFFLSLLVCKTPPFFPSNEPT